jgi:AraC family transcriptional regulator, transcriptional activator of pobA
MNSSDWLLFCIFVIMSQLFKIFRLGPEEAKLILSSPEEPHCHDFEELIVGIEGELEHFIDFKSEKFVSPLISFVTKGKVHLVKPVIKNEKFNIWVIEFRSEFIPETTFQLYSYYHDHANLQLKKGEGFDRMVTLCEMMESEFLQETPDFAVIRLLLSTLFTMIESERKKTENDEKHFYNTQNITFKNFLVILEENFRRPEGVEFYAEKLFMSARNLNLICHNILHKSVSEIIETRKLIEAKNLLISTNKTIAEIGFEIGYNEKAYFTTVFKKKSGQTPSEFRQEMSKLVS